jgi:hypothetical protein
LVAVPQEDTADEEVGRAGIEGGFRWGVSDGFGYDAGGTQSFTALRANKGVFGDQAVAPETDHDGQIP